MSFPNLTAIVSLLALLTYFWMGLRVGVARRKSGIDAPAMSGDPMLERYLRVQGNTLEWLPIFFVSLWLFALYWSDATAAAIGLVWILGRILYAVDYSQAADKRGRGFAIQALAAAILLFGALGKAVLVVLS
ncbi:MAG: MAPEG family protein [Phenylobacterium sp.]